MGFTEDQMKGERAKKPLECQKTKKNGPGRRILWKELLTDCRREPCERAPEGFLGHSSSRGVRRHVGAERERERRCWPISKAIEKNRRNGEDRECDAEKHFICTQCQKRMIGGDHAMGQGKTGSKYHRPEGAMLTGRTVDREHILGVATVEHATSGEMVSLA